jgi:hypothetical protein
MIFWNEFKQLVIVCDLNLHSTKNLNEMKRVLLFLTILLASRLSMHAQAYEGKIEFQKTQQSVAISEVPFQQDVVEDAIKDYMAKKGYKGSSTNGFTLFKGAKLSSNDSVMTDLYFKIEHKSRKEKEVTVISLIPAKANESLVTRSVADDTQLEEAKLFLDQMKPVIEAHELTIQVTEEENTIRKLQKKQDNLVSDESDLEKRIRKLESELDQNKIDQQKQANLIQKNVNQDAAALQKANKKMDHLLDDQGDMQKKLRKSQAELEQNKKDQESLKEDLTKEQQLLDGIKAKQQKLAGA